MKSTLFIACLALALISANAAFRGGASSHSAPSHSAPKASAPVHHTPAPVHHAPAPVHHAPAPVHHAPAPVHHAPVHTPAPVHTAPKAPVHTPAPVAHTPAPTASGNGLSVAQLQKMLPHAHGNTVAQYAPYLNKAMKEAGITTPARQDAFIAQLGHESGQFQYMQELASGHAYEGRCKDLGNCHAGDGVRYKGRGPIQITGRANYAAAGKALGLDLVNHPELAASPEVGFRTAAWYWTTHHLNGLADQNTQSSFTKITKAINGGTNGAADRNQQWRNNERVNPVH